ncbi:MAG: CpXC domain-containing protein [Chloroflexota bacterium]
MPKTSVSCPNCRQPVPAEIDQLFDTNQDPSAKQRFLSGAFNVIQCPVCGYQGALATPLIYHDADKELLLTFVPPELNLPRQEQERMIGGLINQVISKLPQEKRKGYLFNPSTALTLQGMVERVLEAEGITREMIQAQQQRVNLVRRLMSASGEDVQDEIIQQEEALIDAEFFSLLGRFIESAMAGGDKEAAQQLAALQNSLLQKTEYGRQMQEQAGEIQAAVDELRALGNNMTREKLLELVENAPNDTRLSVMVSLVRPAMDYAFFQLLSDRIERARGDGRERLVELRTKLLEMTQEIDKQMQARQQQAQKLVEAILQSGNIGEAVYQNLQSIDDFFVQEVQQMLEAARKQGDLERSAKLNQIVEMLQQLSAPPELELIEEFLAVEEEDARLAFLKAHAEQITPEFIELLGNIASQAQSGDDPDLAEHAKVANRQALRFAMSKNLQA